MAKRFISTELWSDDWFLGMPKELKLFWYYMISKCDHAGIFKVNLRSFCILNEVKLTSNDIINEFNNGKIRIRLINETTWLIEDFFVYQYGTTFNVNNRVHESINLELKKYEIEKTSIRGLKDLKLEVKDGAKDKDKDKDKDKSINGQKFEKLKGETFDEKFEFVFFKDGSKQKLGFDQGILATSGDLKAKSIIQGSIY